MEQEAKGLSEKFNAKCVAYETLERELCGVKETLKKALHTVDAQEKVRGEAKDNQVKCYVLEEQIEVSIRFMNFLEVLPGYHYFPSGKLT
jgi:hypothetical protein